MSDTRTPQQALATLPKIGLPNMELITALMQLFAGNPQRAEDLAYAAVIADSQFVPQGIRGNVGSVFYQLEYARHLGIPQPMALSLTYQTEGGKLAAEGKAILAGLYARKFKVKWPVLSDDGATCRIWRPDAADDDFTERSFTMANAKTIKYAAREDGKLIWKVLAEKFNYRNYPQDMCQWRSFGRCAKVAAADVIGGVLLAEEVDEVASANEALPGQQPEQEPELPAGVGRKPKAKAETPAATQPEQPKTEAAAAPASTAPPPVEQPKPAAKVEQPQPAAEKPESPKTEEPVHETKAPEPQPQASNVQTMPKKPIEALRDKILDLIPDKLHLSPDAARNKLIKFCRAWYEVSDLRGVDSTEPLKFVYHAIVNGYPDLRLLDDPVLAAKCSKELYDCGTNNEWSAATMLQAFRAAAFLDHSMESFMVYLGNLSADKFNDQDAMAFFECAARSRDAALIAGTKNKPGGLMASLGLSFAAIWEKVKAKPDEQIPVALKQLQPAAATEKPAETEKSANGSGQSELW